MCTLPQSLNVMPFINVYFYVQFKVEMILFFPEKEVRILKCTGFIKVLYFIMDLSKLITYPIVLY